MHDMVDDEEYRAMVEGRREKCEFIKGGDDIGCKEDGEEENLGLMEDPHETQLRGTTDGARREKWAFGDFIPASNAAKEYKNRDVLWNGSRNIWK